MKKRVLMFAKFDAEKVSSAKCQMIKKDQNVITSKLLTSQNLLRIVGCKISKSGWNNV